MRHTESATEEALRQEAERLMRHALALGPGTPHAVNLLATAALEGSLPEFAEEILRKVLQKHPEQSASQHLLGCALRDQCRYEEAITSLRRAVEINAHAATFHLSLADALRRQGLLDQSRHHCDQALALEPKNAHAHFTHGNTLYQLGKFDQALAAYRHTLTLDPTHAAAHRNVGVSLFLRGDFTTGYDEYEWRWKLKGSRGTFERLQRPLWQGEPLAGRTLLLHAEQGLGDTVQFVRYVPRIPKDAGRVVLQVQRPLVRLMHRLAGVDEVVARGDPLPNFDLHCPLLSLPRVFATTLETIPKDLPYLRQPEAARGQRAAANLRIGAAWGGNRRHAEDKMRSIPFPQFATLFENTGAQFFRLHRRDAQDDPASTHPNLIDPTDQFTELADTAAFIETLDLVISVDTVIAHLAGALGKPVWTLLPFAPDWRWMLDRSDTPWYPSMRLFRQPAPGAWKTVLTLVKATLNQQHP